jgi:glycosyltransferase involved in cell wall biosynthesis
LFIGKLAQEKGIDKLFQSLPLVFSEYPKSKLVVVGRGKLYHELIALAERLKIADKIVIRNEWLSEEEKILHYGLANVCVIPAPSEAFGNVALEAMAMMVPVVANVYGLSGLKEQVIAQGAEQCGVYVDGTNPSDIANGIKEIFRDEKRAETWGENGRKRVLQYFTWVQAARKTEQLYSRLLR